MPLPALAIPAILDIGGRLIERLFPDPKKADEAKLELLKMQQNGELAQLASDTELAKGQLAVNAAEAASGNTFASSWRPFIGWTCGGGLFYQVLARPLLGWIAQNLWGWSEPPSLEMDTLMTLLFGMLGLSGYRTLEKLKGKAV